MKLPNTEIKNSRVGIYEKAINKKFDWEDKFRMAAKAGFNFIELSIDESDERLERLFWSKEKIYQLRDLAVKHQMLFNSMCLSGHRRFPFGSKDPKVRKKALEIMHQAIVFSKHLGINIIQLAGYDEYYHPSDNQTKKYFIEGIKKACMLAEYYSVFLAFESMDTSFMGTITKIWNVINEINHPLLGIYPDIGNLSQFAKDEFEAEINLGKSKIVAYHFKETKPGVFKEVEFGQGTVPFKDRLKTIKATGFCGPFMIEMWSKNKPEETFDENLDKLKKAHDFFNKSCKEAFDE